MGTKKGYATWPRDAAARSVHAGNVFGRHVMAARDYALERIPVTASPAERSAAERGVHDALYGVMMLLDGVAENALDARHRMEYALAAQVRSRKSGDIVETFQLTPDGDELCIGFHGWVKGGFGS